MVGSASLSGLLPESFGRFLSPPSTMPCADTMVLASASP
eukprot:CAMPEP_0195095490 /NCGR_PEP_ID=MMETSP0448-20130528/46889_1 /TAXON_ID=66468 /ORGANISM="Heterocapsa triquestra, Strain CCMP 448" /LENGTH=38 /DNA_ID= /DNA_START= /DNA_END= /DNA_ORIENTATION=